VSEIERIRGLALAALMTKPEGDDVPWPWHESDPVPDVPPHALDEDDTLIGPDNPLLVPFLDEQYAFMARMNPALVIGLCDRIAALERLRESDRRYVLRLEEALRDAASEAHGRGLVRDHPDWFEKCPHYICRSARDVPLTASAHEERAVAQTVASEGKE
jgi:hypothetical protein